MSKLALDIRSQAEYTLSREFVEENGIRCGYDEYTEDRIIYVIDTKAKTLLTGFKTDIPEIKKQGYKYILASKYFNDAEKICKQRDKDKIVKEINKLQSKLKSL